MVLERLPEVARVVSPGRHAGAPTEELDNLAFRAEISRLPLSGVEVAVGAVDLLMGATILHGVSSMIVNVREARVLFFHLLRLVESRVR